MKTLTGKDLQMAEVLTNEKGEKLILVDGQLYKLVPVTEGKKRGRPKADKEKVKPEKSKKPE